MSDGGFVKRGRGSVHLIPLWCWGIFFVFFLSLFSSFAFSISPFFSKYFVIVAVFFHHYCSRRSYLSLLSKVVFFTLDFLFFVFVMHEKNKTRLQVSLYLHEQLMCAMYHSFLVKNCNFFLCIAHSLALFLCHFFALRLSRKLLKERHFINNKSFYIRLFIYSFIFLSFF